MLQTKAAQIVREHRREVARLAHVLAPAVERARRPPPPPPPPPPAGDEQRKIDALPPPLRSALLRTLEVLQRCNPDGLKGPSWLALASQVRNRSDES